MLPYLDIIFNRYSILSINKSKRSDIGFVTQVEVILMLDQPVVLSQFEFFYQWIFPFIKSRCHIYYNVSILIISSLLIFCLVILPITILAYFGAIPVPGLLKASKSFVIIVPAGISILATILFLAISRILNSDSIGAFILEPSDFSTILIPYTISLNSLGSREALCSGPGRFLSSVKCFSITHAPIATAAIGTRIPVVWSEYPTGTLNSSAIVLIAFRLQSSARAG